MKGIYPVKYFDNPNINKPIEEIWSDIDAYTGEFFEDEPNYHEKIDFMVALPPLSYNGTFMKGIFLTQACDFVLNRFPRIQEIFHAGAYTMSAAYSWCDRADLYFNCYENKARDEYYKNKYPNKKDIIFLPLQDADLTNEYRVAPAFNTEKTIDVICISSPFPVKNLHMLAGAIKIYEQKYGYKLKVTMGLGNNSVSKRPDGTLDYSKADSMIRGVLDKMFEILDGKADEYINFIPFINYGEITKYYTSAKCAVLCSLLEGKNRAINESIMCNTPIITFKDLNKYTVGDDKLFPDGCGELAPEFTAESLADTIYKVINNPQNYSPRINYLKNNGRKNFINTCVSRIPYYRETVPEFEDGKFHDNVWVDMACWNNYQMSFNKFLYDGNPEVVWVRGISKIKNVLDYYYFLFGIKE